MDPRSGLANNTLRVTARIQAIMKVWKLSEFDHLSGMIYLSSLDANSARAVWKSAISCCSSSLADLVSRTQPHTV